MNVEELYEELGKLIKKGHGEDEILTEYFDINDDMVVGHLFCVDLNYSEVYLGFEI